MKKYTGTCHCKAVIFEIESPEEIKSGLSCNCSYCRRKGSLLAFFPETQFTLIQGEEFLTEYRFNKKMISHLFCKVCGVQGFGTGTAPDGEKTVAIHLNCIDDLDQNTLHIDHYDGKNA